MCIQDASYLQDSLNNSIVGSPRVTVNSTLITELTVVSDAVYTYIYFTYQQSTETLQITVTEFPSFLILSLFIIATLLSATVFRRRAR